MKINQMNRLFWVLFSVFVLGYLYVFSQLLILYLVNIPVGLFASVLFPIITRTLFPLALRFITSKWTDEDVNGYQNVQSYIRVWSMRFEWGLFIPTILILSGLLPDGWIKSVFWITIGLLFFIGYPIYARRVLKRTVEDTNLYDRLEKQFLLIGSVMAGMTTVIGFAGVFLSVIGKLLS